MSTTTKEQSVVDAVPKKLYIGGEWRDGAEGTLEVEDPSTGETFAEVADASPDDAVAALAAAHEKQKEWAEHAAARARRDPAPRVRADRGAHRRPGAADDARDGQDDQGVEGRDHLRGASSSAGSPSEAVRIDGRYAVAPNGAGRLLTMKQPVGPVHR